MHKYLLIALLLFCQTVHAQSSLSGIINHYSTVNVINFCESSLTVNDASGFSTGDAVLLIQMQGAIINENNNADFGTISDMGSTGLFERSIIVGINGNVINLDTWLANDYDLNHPVQLLTIPFYENAIVTDTLKAKAWDGSTGGILAFDVNGLLEINAPIDVSGLGFRGAVSEAVADNNCTWLINQDDYVYGADNWRGANKGEGVAIADVDKVAGRGAQANGGGGGNDHNSGGGGGGHGGQGGNGGDNDEPSTFGCDGNFPGLGGNALSNFNAQRIFLGGGGGAGHSNNNDDSWGGNGGGIVMIKAGTINGNVGIIAANGNKANPIVNGDGGGGGGAGGTIWLEAEDLADEIYLSAAGAEGATVSNSNSDRCFGPGGGGAGGIIYANLLGVNTLLSASVNGGLAGITTNSSNSCNGSNLGALPGEIGLTTADFEVPIGEGPVGPTTIITQPSAAVFCHGDIGIFELEASGLGTTYQWEINDGSGFIPLSENTPFSGTQSNTLLIDNITFTLDDQSIRCIVNSTCGDEIFSEIVTLEVADAPLADFDFSINGFEVSFNNQSTGNGSYLWDFGDGESSTIANPVHIYNGEGSYIVSLLFESDCGTATFVDTINLGTIPEPDFSTDMSMGCTPLTVQFTDETIGFVDNYSWSFPGGDPMSSTAQNPVVVYNEAGIYDVILAVTNNAGSISVTYSNVIKISDEPLVSFDGQANGLTVLFNNTTTGAVNYLWDFGDGSSFSIEENPVHAYTTPGSYNVTLIAEAEFCTAEMTLTIEVGPSSTIYLQNKRWAVFPNPVGDELLISSEHYTGELSVELFDFAGRQLRKENLTIYENVLLNMSDLSQGVYLLLVRTRVGEESYFRVMKE